MTGEALAFVATRPVGLGVASMTTHLRPCTGLDEIGSWLFCREADQHHSITLFFYSWDTKAISSR